jgi:hypothetical protein
MASKAILTIVPGARPADAAPEPFVAGLNSGMTESCRKSDFVHMR